MMLDPQQRIQTAYACYMHTAWVMHMYCMRTTCMLRGGGCVRGQVRGGNFGFQFGVEIFPKDYQTHSYPPRKTCNPRASEMEMTITIETTCTGELTDSRC